MELIPNTEHDQQQMLQQIGVSSIEELLLEIPREVRLQRALALPPAATEMELRRECAALSDKDAHVDRYICFLGAGAYDHYIPALVPQIAGRSEYYTAYTPYQAEMSQGLLQTIYEYQTQICEITGLEVANASLYDGASALAEAALMGTRITKRKKVVVSSAINPRYRAVLKSYLQGLHYPIVEVPLIHGMTDPAALKEAINNEVAVVLVQSPNYFGHIEEIEQVSQWSHAQGAIAVCMADPLSLGVLKSPGEMGADVVVGEGQAMGNYLSFGGPYLGFIAGKMSHVRQIPGRIVGATLDSQGRRGYCLTFQTREQHIKRDRATSNICTNQALNALMATIYLSTMGRQGLREVGVQCLQKAAYLKQEISNLPGFSIPFSGRTFKEFVIQTPKAPRVILERLLKDQILGGYDLSQDFPEMDRHLLICVTEKRTVEEMNRLVTVMKEFCP